MTAIDFPQQKLNKLSRLTMCVERAVPGEAEWAELAAPHLARYLFAAEHAAGQRVLDAGSGSGYGARILRAGGAASVLGVDCDSHVVQWARSHFGDDGSEFLVDDCQRLGKVSGTFDLICCFESLEHFERPEAFLAAAAQRLGPEGRLLVSTPDRAVSPPLVDGHPRNPFHVHEWFRDEFHQMLAPHFQQIEMRAQVQSAALASRIAAVESLRQGLNWANPLGAFLWRKLGREPDRTRSWKRLQGLAAASPGDWPILPLTIAPLLGTSHFHMAICSRPKLDEAR